VEVVIETVPEALTIPLGALRRRQDRTLVYRETEDGFEVVDVTPGADNGIEIVIEEGLSEGDVISLTDLGLL
jgi:hypothetical protein